jgi:UDP-N-acetylmuramate: L-alanyl-gamma-D-glutamyl-meso-diaminopimelate ligase
VLLLPPPGHGAGSDELSQDEIIGRIGAAGVKTTKISGREDALSDLKSTLTGEEAILLLSSGPLAGLADALPPMLDASFG